MWIEEPFGPSPYEEECAQVGAENYGVQSRVECKVLVAQLRRMFGPEPGDSRLKIVANNHDFGTYREVNYCFDNTDAECRAYYTLLEDEFPAKWDGEAIRILRGTVI